MLKSVRPPKDSDQTDPLPARDVQRKDEPFHGQDLPEPPVRDGGPRDFRIPVMY